MSDAKKTPREGMHGVESGDLPVLVMEEQNKDRLIFSKLDASYPASIASAVDTRSEACSTT
jgi:hypothetical protein